MPFKTFTDGTTLPASDLNTYLAKQAVIVCTSTTRPSSPPVGMTIWETDTARMMVYTAAGVGWQPPWNLPWGNMGVAASTSDTSFAANEQKVFGNTIYFQAIKGRKYHLHGQARIGPGGAGTFHFNPIVTIGGASMTALVTSSLPGAAGTSGNSLMVACDYYFSCGLTGYVTIAPQGWSYGTTSTYYAGATISLDDIGPNGLPA
jgi:hypothetical protein